MKCLHQSTCHDQRSSNLEVASDACARLDRLSSARLLFILASLIRGQRLSLIAYLLGRTAQNCRIARRSVVGHFSRIKTCRLTRAKTRAETTIVVFVGPRVCHCIRATCMMRVESGGGNQLLLLRTGMSRNDKRSCSMQARTSPACRRSPAASSKFDQG